MQWHGRRGNCRATEFEVVKSVHVPWCRWTRVRNTALSLDKYNHHGNDTLLHLLTAPRVAVPWWTLDNAKKLQINWFFLEWACHVGRGVAIGRMGGREVPLIDITKQCIYRNLQREKERLSPRWGGMKVMFMVKIHDMTGYYRNIFTFVYKTFRSSRFDLLSMYVLSRTIDLNNGCSIKVDWNGGAPPFLPTRRKFFVLHISGKYTHAAHLPINSTDNQNC